MQWLLQSESRIVLKMCLIVMKIGKSKSIFYQNIISYFILLILGWNGQHLLTKMMPKSMKCRTVSRLLACCFMGSLNNPAKIRYGTTHMHQCETHWLHNRDEECVLMKLTSHTHTQLCLKRILEDLQETDTIWRLCKFANKMAACQFLSVWTKLASLAGTER